MALGETLSVYSLEGFFAVAEIERLTALIDAMKSPGAFDAEGRDLSVFRMDRLGLEETIRLYVPKGRIEIDQSEMPEEVIDLLETAFFRRIEDVRRAFPSATWPAGWTYVEYGRGQFCSAHADGRLDGAQVGGLSVPLNDDFRGGEFFVETCGGGEMWCAGTAGPELSVEPNPYFESFDRIPRSRWTVSPVRGDAALYGSLVVHGTRPVRRGRARKIICFLRSG
jgi:hypothetical protein